MAKRTITRSGRRVRKGAATTNSINITANKVTVHKRRQGNDVEKNEAAYTESVGEKKDVKTARVELRFTQQQQKMMEKASDILGYKNTSEYIRHIVQENALKVLREQSILEIAEQDRQRVMDEINHPAEPNDAFKQAVDFYRNTIKR